MAPPPPQPMQMAPPPPQQQYVTVQQPVQQAPPARQIQYSAPAPSYGQTYNPGITLETSPNGQIVIVAISPDSSTWHSSLKIGDTVVAIDNADVRTVSEARRLLQGDHESVLLIQTDENEVSVVRDVPGPRVASGPDPGAPVQTMGQPMGQPMGQGQDVDESRYGNMFVKPGEVGSMMSAEVCQRYGVPVGTIWGPSRGRRGPEPTPYMGSPDDVRGTQV
mmetsp:Transcript_72192/g.150829  ORF Transcript_72192/g.150829 Transcript_72192/m.150829 type:complete len:220 (-) Transcript_72192:127-786(-)